jgi:hypothetical protein
MMLFCAMISHLQGIGKQLLPIYYSLGDITGFSEASCSSGSALLMASGGCRSREQVANLGQKWSLVDSFESLSWSC